MVIRLIAKELYRLYREVERLEAAVAEAPPDHRPKLQEQLRRVRAERDRLRRVLDGSKDNAAGSRK
jgi:hypothetical protein